MRKNKKAREPGSDESLGWRDFLGSRIAPGTRHMMPFVWVGP